MTDVQATDHASWLPALGGRFIVFDGPDGSGKSTQFGRFAECCRGAGLDVVETREPGGTEIGERIRDILLDPALGEMDVRCEAMLYMASRAQLVNERIRPALDRGAVVLADRFVSSTLAYQGTAGGLDEASIMDLARVAVGDCWPDLVVIFDVDDGIAARRLGGKGGGEPTLFSDRMERKHESFRHRVREGFRAQLDRPELGSYLLVDAAPDPDTIFAALMDGVHRTLARQA